MLLAQLTLEWLGSTAVSAGLPAALVVFFVWNSSKREDRLVAKVDSLETYQRTEMATMIENGNKAHRRTAYWMKKLTQSMNGQMSACREHGCKAAKGTSLPQLDSKVDEK